MKILLALISLALFSAELDLKNSQFTWKGSKVVGDKHYGKIFLKSGSLDTNDNKITGGKFVMDMKTFTVDDLEGKWEKKFLGHMKNADFFEVDKFPTSSLVIKKVTGNKITGDLTLKGVTKSITFPYSAKDSAFIGTMAFDRTKWGIKYGSGKFFDNLGDKVISDEITVDFKLVTK